MTIFFTADTHWGHEAIIKHTHRPWQAVDEHDEMLVQRWNRVVRPGDTIYHLGDFALVKYVDTETIVTQLLSRLNGQVHLIKGNHDRGGALKAPFVTINDIKRVKIGGQLIYCCHYAMRVWNQSHYGSYHLYGHSHGSLEDLKHSRSFDVGVDCWNYAPVSFEEVVETMGTKTWKPIDHHGHKR